MKDDYRTGCRNVSHCQQQQPYSGLRSPGRSYSNYLWNDSWILICNIRSEKELEPKYLPQLFLGSLLVTRRSAIGQIFFLSLVTVPEVFAWVNSAQFLLVSKVANVSLFYLSAVFINDAVGVAETVFVHGYQVMAAVGAHQ